MVEIKQEANVRTHSGSNFAAVHAGSFDNLDQVKLEVPSLNRTSKGKLFIKEYLGMTGMQISLNKLPAGKGLPFLHKHKQNEEAYIFIKGRGQMQIDGEIFDVEEGTVVRVATGGSRGIRSSDETDLEFICIQAKENSLSQDTFDDGIKDETVPSWN
jgi:mannose-6-phosphate isomerase-like protein (cupin superfamily)